MARTRRRSKSALVLGADGLLGSHLVRELLGQGVEVRVFVQPDSTSPTLDDLPIEVVRGDLLGRVQDLRSAAEGCDWVFHCAAVTDLWADREQVWAVNFDGTLRVADACLRQGVRRLVFVGSASSFQYGTQEQPGDESGGFPRPHRGIPYMESKHRAMRLVLDYVAERELDAVVVAPTMLLGRYDWRPSSGELIRQYVARNMRFTAPGGRCFAHAPDVALALVAAAERGRRGDCYLAGGHNLSYRRFFTEVARIAGIAPPSATVPAAVLSAIGAVGSAVSGVTGRKVALNRTLASLASIGSYYSSAKAVSELGMPVTPLERAIEETLDGLREYGHIE